MCFTSWIVSPRLCLFVGGDFCFVAPQDACLVGVVGVLVGVPGLGLLLVLVSPLRADIGVFGELV